MQAKLSQCYDTVNNVFDYCGVETNLHAFSATAVDGDVQLNSTSIYRYALYLFHGVTTQIGGNRKKNVLLHIYENWNTVIQTVDFSPYTMSSFDFMHFSLYSYTQNKEKKSYVWYVSQLHVISSPGTTDCIKLYIFSCPECLKSQKVAFQFLLQCLYAALPPSNADSTSLQWSVDQTTSLLTSMLFFCISFIARSTVFSSGRGVRYKT